MLACSASARCENWPALNGTWRLDWERPWGVTISTFITLHTDGAELDGTVIQNGAGILPILKPRLSGAHIRFATGWGWNFDVLPQGSDLAVVAQGGDGSRIEAVAARIADSAALPLAAIPPPPLRDLGSNGLTRTPPMGWNSWNHFADRVNDRTIRETAAALARSGMAAAGYLYVNIDDTWEGGRDDRGNLVPNHKFPDMKALAAYVHGLGLKLGIYSTPGPKTCGGYEGSYGHEEQDARTFAAWGIDYLKYDWCSASRIYTNADLQGVYQRMGEALLHSGRPIVYSLCEYGMGDVWQWGPKVGANLWRTTGDIQDNWRSMMENGFRQNRLARFAGPGHWNDPDMLEVGNGGMTDDENRTHFSLWCMLAAPLIAGNDLRRMSASVRDILTNREAIAVDQDSLGHAATRILSRDGWEVWSRPLTGGATAIAVINRAAEARSAALPWSSLGLAPHPQAIRDLWAHRELSTTDDALNGEVPAYGVLLLTVGGA